MPEIVIGAIKCFSSKESLNEELILDLPQKKSSLCVPGGDALAGCQPPYLHPPGV